ncbi:MAG TPA: type II toxin-antitoxin system VapB family antitoxin [Chloroflexota bacterium]|jgi:Arc/MetJ family transcription regulator|nr:type II toxin-antitoxin system VapB family antitoxin [Chloroflexota bacterium]
MRTNVDIDDELLCEAQQLSGLKTKHDVVQEALRALIRYHRQQEIKGLRAEFFEDYDVGSMRRNKTDADAVGDAR